MEKLLLQCYTIFFDFSYTCSTYGHSTRNCRSSPPDDCPFISYYVALNSNLSKLKILRLNCCSLRSSQTLIDERNPDTICESESHLGSSYFNAEIFLLHIQH